MTSGTLLTSLASLEREGLIAIIVQQAKLIEELGERVIELETKVNEHPGSAAPFRLPAEKRKAEATKKRPGQKDGHKGNYLRKPEQVDEEVEVRLETCPRCGNALSDPQAVEQWLVDLPEVKPTVTKLTTYRAKCGSCGEVESVHPLKVSSAIGAAGVHLGANALGLAVSLSQQQGLSKRNVCEVMKTLTGVPLSAGGWSQLLHRAAHRLEGVFLSLCQRLEQSSVLPSDETGWWVSGKRSLWVLCNQAATRYEIVSSKTKGTVQQRLGNFKGVLVSDCLNIYDFLDLQQQKCYAHHLKAIAQAQRAFEQKQHQPCVYLNNLKQALQQALLIKTVWTDIDAKRRQETLERLAQQFQQLLPIPRLDPREQAMRDRLRKQQDHLLTFLHYPDVPATNNLAERQLRPAVIHRKISAGNKTDKGASTWQILASIATTCRQQSRSFHLLVAEAFRLDRSPVLFLR
jgi:transposase